MMIGLNERARFFRMRAEAEAPQAPTRRAESHSQRPLPLCKRNIPIPKLGDLAENGFSTWTCSTILDNSECQKCERLVYHQRHREFVRVSMLNLNH